MTQFFINPDQPEKLNNSTLGKNVPPSVPPPKTDSSLAKDRISHNKTIFSAQPESEYITNNTSEYSIDNSQSLPLLNNDTLKKNYDRSNVRIALDTRAIRQNQFNIFLDRFNPNFPIPDNYFLCPQKISTVFNNGKSYWTSSYNPAQQVLSFDAVKYNAANCSFSSIGCPPESYIDLDLSVIYYDGSSLIFNKNIQVPRFLKVTVTDSDCLNINGDYIFDLLTNDLYSTTTNIYRASLVISSFPEDLILIVLYPENNTEKYLSIQSKFVVNPSTNDLQEPWVVSNPSELGQVQIIGCSDCTNSNGSLAGYRIEGIYTHYGSQVLCYPQVAQDSEFKLPINVTIEDSTNTVYFGIYYIIPGYAGFDPDEFDKNTVPYFESFTNKTANSREITLNRTQIYKFNLGDSSLNGLSFNLYTDSSHTDPYTNTSSLGVVGEPGSYMLLYTDFSPSPSGERLYWTLGSYSGIVYLPLPVIPDDVPDGITTFPVPAPCYGGHGCMRARFDVLINEIKTIESNANNTLGIGEPPIQNDPADFLDVWGRPIFPANYWETLYDPEIVNRLKTTYNQQWPRHFFIGKFINDIDLGYVHVVNGSVTPEGIGLSLYDRLTYGYITKEQDRLISENSPPPDPSHNGNLIPFTVSVRSSPQNGTFVDKDTFDPLTPEDYDNNVPNGIWRGGHAGVTWVRIKDCGNNTIYSCCVGEGYGNPSCPTCPTDNPPPPEPTFPPPPESLGCKLYVTNVAANSVSIINSYDGSLISNISIDVGIQPDRLYFDKQNKRLYVANFYGGGSFSFGTISIIDTETDSIIDTIVLNDNYVPLGMGVYNNRLYITHQNGNFVTVDLSTQSIINTLDISSLFLPFGDSLKDIIIINNIGYVLSSNKLHIINLDTYTVIKTFTSSDFEPSPPFGYSTNFLSLDLDNRTDKIYITNAAAQGSNPNIYVIDTISNTVSNKINLYTAINSSSYGIFINSKKNRAYICNSGLNISGYYTVSVVSTISDSIIANIELPPACLPRYCVVQNFTDRLYVACENNTVVVIDTDTNSVIDSFSTPYTPRDIDIVSCEPYSAPIPTETETDSIEFLTPSPTFIPFTTPLT